MTDARSPLLRDAWKAWSEDRFDDLAALCRAAAPRIVDEFSAWQAEASRLGGSAADAARQATFLDWVARFLASECGRPEAAAMLDGLAPGGPIEQWQADVDEATALGRAGRWGEAAAAIARMDAEVRTWKGPGALPYRAATLQMRGKMRFHLGEQQRAIADVRAARDLWLEAGDRAHADVCASMLAELGVSA